MEQVRAPVVLVATWLAVGGCDRVFHLERHDTDDAAPVDVAPMTVGCSDGTRELLVVTSEFPKVAGCAGSWSVKGLEAIGMGTASSLCAEGWHICAGASEFRTRGGVCAAGADVRYLFATAQRSAGALVCEAVGSNEIFGCGQGFGHQVGAPCSPLDRAIGTDTAADNGVWDVGNDETMERDNVVKGTGPGGVLCCANE